MPADTPETEGMVLVTARSLDTAAENSLRGYARVAMAVSLLHLLLGAALAGVLMLFEVVRGGSVQAIPRVWAEAHANSQIVGVLGLAVVALACTILPRVKGIDLSKEGWASLSISCLIVGSVMHALCHGLQETLWPDQMLLGSLTASFVQVIGWGYFVVLLLLILRDIPKERQKRFEKCILVGAVWFGAGMALVILVRLMWLANVWVVSIHPRANFGLRYLQIMAGAFLMVVGLSQPVFRGWPKDAAWRPRLLPQSTLWGIILAAFLVSVASPWAGVLEPGWVPGILTAAAVLNIVAVASYLISQTSLTRRVRQWDEETVSPWRGPWIGPSVWLALSGLGTGALVLCMAWWKVPFQEAWFHVVVHAFVLGFLFPQILLTFRHFGLLWRWGQIGTGLTFLYIGLVLFMVGYPWMLWYPGSLAQWVVYAGAGLEGAAVFLLALTGLVDLISGGKEGC
jgi:hypothetical protein